MEADKIEALKRAAELREESYAGPWTWDNGEGYGKDQLYAEGHGRFATLIGDSATCEQTARFIEQCGNTDLRWAADTIESQRAEIDRLREKVEQLEFTDEHFGGGETL